MGHVSLDEHLDAKALSDRIANTPCSCCKAKRAAEKKKQAAANKPSSTAVRFCFTCQQPGHLVVNCPLSHCHSCGRSGHLARVCTFGQSGSITRDDQFLTCSSSGSCFIRRFIVPLHRARKDFDPTTDDLTVGRIDVACRLVASSLIASQRLRHNTQIYLPFLGEEEKPTTLCISGGPVRRLHPSEADTARRMRLAIDRLSSKDSGAGEDEEEAALEVRGFRLMQDCGLKDAVEDAVAQARADGNDNAKAPLLLLLEGAPPLAQVLAEYGLMGVNGGARQPLTDLIVVLGDDKGLSEEEVAMVKEAAVGGPVLCASLGETALLASQCITILHHYLDAIHSCPPRLWEGPAEEVKYLARQGKRRADQRRRRARKEEEVELG